MYMRRSLHGPLRSEKMEKKHVTLISDTLKKANHLNSFIIYIYNMSIYSIYIYTYLYRETEMEGGWMTSYLLGEGSILVYWRVFRMQFGWQSSLPMGQ